MFHGFYFLTIGKSNKNTNRKSYAMCTKKLTSATKSCDSS